MNIITIPDDFNLDLSASVEMFEYCSSQKAIKQQITLSRNTISFLIEGVKDVYFENSSLTIDSSKFIIMRSGNCLMTEKLSDLNNYRSVLLFFSNDILLKFIRKFGLNKTDAISCRSVYDFKCDEFVKRFIDSLLDVSELSVNIKHNLLEVKFEEIMLYLIDKYGADFLYSLIPDNSNAVQKFHSTIENNQLNKLTLRELAFLCNMSVSSFKREFEKYYSESPIKWFQNKRLEYAYYLLHQEQKSPSDIYYEVGYENLSSFIQAYKAKYGVTPKQDIIN